jgi:iron complex transport system substrate-binding protein
VRSVVSALYLLLTGTLCLLGACSAPPPTTTRPAGPRVISTVPAATSIIMQLGAAKSLVGVTKYDKLMLPAELGDLPVIGDYLDLNYELLYQAHPTAVIVFMSSERVPPRLRELAQTEGFEIHNLKLDTIADLYTTTEALGRMAGCPDTASARIAATRGELAEIQAQYASRTPTPRVAYVIGRNPLMLVGRGVFLDELITLAGGHNVGAELGQGWPVTNRERLLQLQPDVLLIGTPGEPPAQAEDPRLAPWLRDSTPAARNQRIYLHTDPNGQLLTLDIAQQARELARNIHAPTP